MGLDIGAQRVRTVTAANEAAPLELITAGGLQPTDVTRPWKTADLWVRGSGPWRPDRDRCRQGGSSMSEVITAVYEISAEDPAGRAAQVAVEQSHGLRPFPVVRRCSGQPPEPVCCLACNV
jgi:hypothetical protein